MISNGKSLQPRGVTHPYLALMGILILVANFVNVIPSGQYNRISANGRTIVDPTSYHLVDKVYSGPGQFFLSFYYGFVNVSSLMAMVFFVGAGFGVVKRIGLLTTAIAVIAQKMKKLPFMVTSLIIMLLIALQVTITGMWELNLVLLPIVIPLFLTLGYDVMTGVGVVMISSCAGFGCSFTNPFSTAIAHQIAELPIYSGIWYRAIAFSVIFTVGWIFLMIYAGKIKKHPEKSLSKDLKSVYESKDGETVVFTPALIRAGIVFLLCFGFLIFGTVKLKFAFAEMSAVFAAMGLLVGIAYGAKPNEICGMFSEGMKDMFFAGTVMLFARSILYIMEKTLVIDTVIMFLAQFIVHKSHALSAVLMLIMQTIINFIIPSGSGQAMVTMPIMVPLADMAGITRQVASLAFQFGDGFSNFIYFTNGSFIAMLMVAGIPYGRWIKFFGPLFVIITFLSAVFVVIGVAINFGPF